MNLQAKPDAFAGVPVIDADTHYAEPYDLWTSRAPAAWKDRMPQVKEVDGELSWQIPETASIQWRWFHGGTSKKP